MPHLESKTKLIMTASVNWYINPIFKTIIVNVDVNSRACVCNDSY